MHTTSTRADRTAYPFHATSATASYPRPVRSNRRTVRRVPVLRLAAQFGLAVAAFAALAHYF